MKDKIKSYLKILLKIILILGFLILLYASSIFVYKNLSDTLAKNILEYLRVLVWPAVTLIAVFIFRINIARLIERMEEWEIPGLGKGRAHAAEITQQQESVKKDTPVMPRDEGDDFKAIVAVKETEIKSLRENESQLIDKLTRAQIELDFERIYNVIFASQIDLLLKINNFPQVEFAYIVEHYTKVQRAAAPIFDKWNISLYIQFLINQKLVEYKVGTIYISITQKGKAFLSYLTIMNYKKYGI
jgi:hypothetical protein